MILFSFFIALLFILFEIRIEMLPEVRNINADYKTSHIQEIS
jgi:hypothetical protein